MIQQTRTGRISFPLKEIVRELSLEKVVAMTGTRKVDYYIRLLEQAGIYTEVQEVYKEEELTGFIFKNFYFKL